MRYLLTTMLLAGHYASVGPPHYPTLAEAADIAASLTVMEALRTTVITATTSHNDPGGLQSW